jgi:RND family efflux transporter MFP subunit
MRTIALYWLLTLCISLNVRADDELELNAKQIQTLGIATAALTAKQQGELAGMPAQVVVPGNQLHIISTPLPAVVEQTLVGVGDNVRKGQVLARLQSPALAEAQRGLLQAATQEQLAKDSLARDEQLLREGIIAESRYRTTQSLYLEASAVLAERRQALRLAGMPDAAIAQLQSGNSLNSLLAVTSPIDGVVLEKSADAGQRLDAAAPMFKVAKLEPLGLEIQAPSASTRGLKIGAKVTVPAFGAQGKLIAIGRSLTGANQTVLLRATIHQGAENLRPGQFVEATINTGANGGAQWNVPNSAIARIAGKTVVFVQTPQGFRVQAINVLNEGAQNSVISGNLKGDEKIAVRGVSTLKASAMGIGGMGGEE